MNDSIGLRCKAILFDMDGTLVDSTPVVERGWSMWASRYEIPLDELLAFSHGRPASSVLEKFFPGRDHTADIEELNRFEEETTEGILAVPGASEILHLLQSQSLPWAIVTSAWRSLAVTRVTAAGLPLPEVIVPVDEIQNGKPHPEGFLLAATQLGVAPEDCIVFEDTRPGINAGLSAGMQVVGLTTTYKAQTLRHDLLIRDFRDVAIDSEGDILRVDLKHHSGD